MGAARSSGSERPLLLSHMLCGTSVRRSFFTRHRWELGTCWSTHATTREASISPTYAARPVLDEDADSSVRRWMEAESGETGAEITASRERERYTCAGDAIMRGNQMIRGPSVRSPYNTTVPVRRHRPIPLRRFITPLSHTENTHTHDSLLIRTHSGCSTHSSSSSSACDEDELREKDKLSKYS